MEWMNRGGNAQHQNTQQTNSAPQPTATKPAPKAKKNLKDYRVLKVLSIVLLFTVTILMLAVICYLAFVRPQNKQSKYVDSSKYQAVFLNGGQVYFGKITALNAQYTSLADIYYLRVNQQVQPNGNTQNQNDVQLVKLGCELHGPQDQMVINREQIIFWENLKDDGQVAQAVSKYKQQNPDGQKCQTNNQSSNGTNTGTSNNSNSNNTNSGN